MFCNKTMFRYAKNVRLVSFLKQAFQMAITGFLPVSLWLSMALCDSHSGSHWLSLPLSGKLWPSLAHYYSLILRTQSLIGSQRRCHADALSPALATINRHNKVWMEKRWNKCERGHLEAASPSGFCTVGELVGEEVPPCGTSFLLGN